MFVMCVHGIILLPLVRGRRQDTYKLLNSFTLERSLGNKRFLFGLQVRLSDLNQLVNSLSNCRW